ncbi:MAG: MBL fold metallo-hydrolase [Lentisphaerota bacterium]
MSTFHLTVLVDNKTARPDLAPEHGFSLWIESPDARVLFDTGQGPALPHNATRLGLRLHEASAIVLSHGHYDHTGGLACALDQNKKAPIYLHPEALRPRFSRHADQTMHAIGMPPGITERLRALPERTLWTTQPVEISRHMWTTGPIPRETSFEDTGGSFFLDEHGTTPDPIQDDQALWMETAQGLVVILGCAHSGVVNTLSHISKLTGARTFHAVMGGLHLGSASPERLAATVEALSRYHMSVLGPAHCTGAAEFLAKHVSNLIVECGTGKTFVI